LGVGLRGPLRRRRRRIQRTTSLHLATLNRCGFGAILRALGHRLAQLGRSGIAAIGRQRRIAILVLVRRGAYGWHNESPKLRTLSANLRHRNSGNGRAKPNENGFRLTYNQIVLKILSILH
jgi:hypothetical protein